MKRAVWILAAAWVTLSACAQNTAPEPSGRIVLLERDHEDLHRRIEAATKNDALITAVYADQGTVIVAIRSKLIEELAGSISKRYLDNVKVDLEDVHAKSSGEIKRKTFLGRVKVGAWNVSVELGNMVGDLRAGAPTVSLRAPNMIDLAIPVNVLESFGEARLSFGWDSAGVANILCKDFELDRGIRGRVLPQKHVITGAMRLTNTGASLTATPFFLDKKVSLRLDLTKESWATVEEALRSQNTSSTCGAFMKPEQVLTFLKELAAKGINVNLPESIFRTVRLPASLRQEVTVNRRVVSLSIQGESLRVQGKTLWSSASILVQTGPTPAPTPTSASSR